MESDEGALERRASIATVNFGSRRLGDCGAACRAGAARLDDDHADTPFPRARRHDGSDANGHCVEWVVLYNQLSIDHQIAMDGTPIQWDLAPVAVDAEEVEAEVDDACRRFAERYRGRIGALGPEELAEALAELGRIRGALVHLTGLARLRVAENVDGAAERAAGAKADAVAAGAEELLRFFELEWLALPESRVEELCAAPPLAHAAPLLRSIRRFAPYVLSEAEERALAAREAGAFEAWLALYEQVVWTVEL
jgi:hypothetical protein